LAEVKKVYQPIQMRAGDLARGQIELQNWGDFSSAEEWLSAEWRVTADGVVLQQGPLKFGSLAPREKKLVSIPLTPITPAPGAEYFVEVVFKLKSATPWANAGHEVAWEQFKLPWSAPAQKLSAAANRPLKVDRSGDGVVVAGQDFAAAFSSRSGWLVSLKSGDVELLDAPLAPHFWRAPVDNDRGNRMAGPDNVGGNYGSHGMSLWRDAHESWVAKSVNVTTPAPGVAIIAVEGMITKLGCRQVVTWTVLGSGDILVSTAWYPGNGMVPELPRFGMQTTLRAGFDQLTWLGKGPQETYWDRQDARVGLYRGKVSEQFFPYIKPQETGNKESVRWIALTDEHGRGLLAIGDPLLSANALHYTTEDLSWPDQKTNFYPYQLPDRRTITFDLDLHQRGLGGDDSWGALPHEQFRFSTWPTTFQYRLHVLRGGEEISRIARLQVSAPDAPTAPAIAAKP
jgi:beta-galactosidase